MPTSTTILIDDAVVTRLIQTHADSALKLDMAVTMINEDPAGEDDPNVGAGSAAQIDRELRIVSLEVTPMGRQRNPGDGTDGGLGGHVDEAEGVVELELVQGPGETLESTLADKSAAMKVARAFDEETLEADAHRIQFGRASRKYRSGTLDDEKVTLCTIRVPFEVVRESGHELESN